MIEVVVVVLVEVEVKKQCKVLFHAIGLHLFHMKTAHILSKIKINICCCSVSPPWVLSLRTISNPFGATKVEIGYPIEQSAIDRAQG